MSTREEDRWGERKRAKRSRNFMVNTCPASRHVHMMADGLWERGSYHMFGEEPKHCALGIYSVLSGLWEARTALQAMRPEGITDDGERGWWWESKSGKRHIAKRAKSAARAEEERK